MRNAIIILLLAAAVVVPPVFGGTTGKVSGRVIDKTSKEPLAGANVVIEGTALGAAVGPDGSFVIIDVHPGTYRVRATFIGYAPMTIQEVRVNLNQTTTLLFELSESAVQSSEVIVTAERPMVRKDATGTVAIVTKEDIQVLPVNNFVDILRIQAGVVGEGSAIHIRGGRGNEVSYMIDGVYVKDPLFGGIGTELHKEAIEQMEFLSGTFSAEYGDAMSGVVNLVTREGTERQSVRLDARTSEFAAPYKNYHEGRLSASLSGPIPLVNRVKYLLTGERDYRGSWLPFGYDNNISFMGKLSANLLADLRGTATYRLTQHKYQNYQHDWKYIPDEYYQPRTSSEQGMVQVKHVLSPKAFYDIRASYFTQHYQLGILGPDGNYLDTSKYLVSSQWDYKPDAGNGLEFYSRAIPLEYTDSHTKTLNVKGDLVWQIGTTHEVKTGLEFKQHDLSLFSVYDPKRNFPYLNDYKRNPIEGAMYVQDKMEFPSLVINVGLRLDYADQQAAFRMNPLDPNSLGSSKPKYQFSPRLGIAHPISDRTTLHFSYGHFFQNPDYQYLFDNSQYDVNVREPIFGQPNLDAQRTVAYQVGIGHQFSDYLAATFTAYYKDVTGLIGTHYYQPFFDGRYVGYTLYVNEDYGNMKGFEVDVTLRRANYVSGALTYTYSVAKGSASSETEQYPGTQESTLLYYLDFDKTHIINANVSVELPENAGPILQHTYWNFILRTSSGYPYTPGGRDVGFVVRNSARRPWTFTLDAEIGRDWTIGPVLLTTYVDVRNLTNYRNVLYVYTDTGLPDQTFVGRHSQEWIQDPSNFGPPRRIQIGARLSF